MRMEVLILEKFFGFWIFLVLFMCSSWKENDEVRITNSRLGGQLYNQKHRLHNYVIIIYSFGPKPALVVQTHPRWSQGTLAYFQNSPPLMVLLSIKTNTIFIPWYLASIGQVPAKFHEKHNNLSISENGMFFILWDFMLSNCTSKYTKKNLGNFYSTQNSLTTNFYYMFSLKLRQGEPAHMLVPSPFEWGLLVTILSSKNVWFELRGPDLLFARDICSIKK